MLDEEASRKRIARHLEYLGYTCEVQKDGWLYASHPLRWNIFVRPTPVGTQFFCAIELGMVSDRKRLAFLEFCNRTNGTTLAVRFTFDWYEPNRMFVLFARALAPCQYQRRTFGTWLDLWHRELERLREGPSLEPETEIEEGEQEKTEPVSIN